MANKTVKLTKFEKIESELQELSKRYGDAILNDDKEELEAISRRYKELRVLMLSNEDYFINYNPKALKSEIQDEEDLERKYQLQEQLRLKKQQRRLYKSNNAYIGTIDKSLTMAEYVKRNKNKTWNFVRKHFKKIILTGVLIGGLAVGLKSCSKEEKDKFDKTRDIPQTTTEAVVTQETTTNDYDKNTKEETTETTKTQTSNVEDLIVIPVKPADPYINGYIPKFGREGFNGTGEVIESLVPNVSNSSSNNVVTTTTIVNTPSVTESDPQEYVFTEKEETLIPANEIVTITETEQKTETNVNNIPIEEGTSVEYTGKETIIKEETKVENGEKITIVEKEVKTETNVNNIPIDGEETKVEVKEEVKPEIKDTEIPSEEKVTITEKEELTNININNIPIDETVEIIENKTNTNTVINNIPLKEATEEKVTITEKEEKTTINNGNNLPIDGEETKVEVKEEVKTEIKDTEIPSEEKVTIVEVEEKTTISNGNNLPIDGEATVKEEKVETKSKVEIPTEERITEIEQEEFENSLDIYSLPIDEVEEINEQTASEEYTLTLKM